MSAIELSFNSLCADSEKVSSTVHLLSMKIPSRGLCREDVIPGNLTDADTKGQPANILANLTSEAGQNKMLLHVQTPSFNVHRAVCVLELAHKIGIPTQTLCFLVSP